MSTDNNTLTDVTLLIPASGFSARFGHDDKLLAPLAGKALAQHSLDTLSAFPFARRIAVLPDEQAARRAIFERAGFEIIINAAPDKGMKHSVSLGARACVTHRLLLCLPDMPRVPQCHIASLLAVSAGQQSGVVMSVGELAQPPAVIIGPMIETLARGGIMRDHITATVPIAAEFLSDIDTQDELRAMARNWLTRDAARDRNDP